MYDRLMWENLQPCVSKDSFDALQSNMDTCVKTRRNPELTVLRRDPRYPPYDKPISIFYKADIELQTKQLAILKKNLTCKTWFLGIGNAKVFPTNTKRADGVGRTWP